MPRRAALTFDDGPDPIWTPRVLDALADLDARATFFVMAGQAADYPEVVHRTLDAGHTVAFHCHEHLRHTGSSREAIAADTERGLHKLSRLGVTPGFWRPPWGFAEDWTWELAEEFGLTLVGWTADTHDWRGDPAGEMHDAMGPALGEGAVVLMHDGLGPGALRDGCAETIALARIMVPTLRQIGCEPVTIAKLGEVPPPRGAAPRQGVVA